MLLTVKFNTLEWLDQVKIRFLDSMISLNYFYTPRKNLIKLSMMLSYF